MNEEQVRSVIPTEIVGLYGVRFEGNRLNIGDKTLITVYYNQITEIEHDELYNRIRLHCGKTWVSFSTRIHQMQVTVWDDE